MKGKAAALIIGNEVLTAKVLEANGAHLIRRLRDRGIPLAAMMIVPDEVEKIRARVKEWIEQLTTLLKEYANAPRA